jgi:ketosteroid isomerase-like protein
VSEQPSTPDRLAIVRRSFEAGSRLDFDGALAPFAPDGVWDMSRIGMGVLEGHDAIRAFFEEWRGAYEDYEITLEEVRDLGNGVTFLVAFQRGTPTGSTGSVELRYATVSTWNDGLVEGSTHYTDIDDARVAAERLAEERGYACQKRT